MNLILCLVNLALAAANIYFAIVNMRFGFNGSVAVLNLIAAAACGRLWYKAP